MIRRVIDYIIEPLLWALAIIGVLAACAVAGAAQPVLREPVCERCDLIEVNKFYDPLGRTIFEQIIFYDWEPRSLLLSRTYYDTTTQFSPTTVTHGGETYQVMQPDTVKVESSDIIQRGFAVRAWRLVKHPSQRPTRDYKNGGYTAVWQDGEIMRRVNAPSMRETWTQYDPELFDREFLPKEQRRELRTVITEKPVTNPPFVREWPAEGP